MDSLTTAAHFWTSSHQKEADVISVAAILARIRSLTLNTFISFQQGARKDCIRRDMKDAVTLGW